LNGTNHFLVYVYDHNLLAKIMNIMKINKEALLHACKGFDVEVSAERTEYMLMFYHQNAGQNHNIKIANKSFKNVTIFKYF